MGSVSEITIAQAIYENFDKVKDISENIIQMNFNFLGMNLGEVPSFTTFNLLFFLPLISGATSFLLTKLTTWLQFRSTGVAPQQNNNAMMTLMGPIMSIWIGYSLPIGLTLYWITGNLVSMVQEVLLTFYFDKKKAKDELRAPEEKNNTKKTSKGAKKK